MDISIDLSKDIQMRYSSNSHYCATHTAIDSMYQSNRLETSQRTSLV